MVTERSQPQRPSFDRPTGKVHTWQLDEKGLTVKGLEIPWTGLFSPRDTFTMLESSLHNLRAVINITEAGGHGKYLATEPTSRTLPVDLFKVVHLTNILAMNLNAPIECTHEVYLAKRSISESQWKRAKPFLLKLCHKALTRLDSMNRLYDDGKLLEARSQLEFLGEDVSLLTRSIRFVGLGGRELKECTQKTPRAPKRTSKRVMVHRPSKETEIVGNFSA